MANVRAWVCSGVLLALVACGAGDDGGDDNGGGDDNSGGDDSPAGPRCGDGMCNGSETTATCAADCPCTAATATAADTCTGENICINGACVSAFGRQYAIVIYDGAMKMNNAAGETWDVPGGLPDPFVRITLNGQALGETSVKSDTLAPMWNEGGNVVIPGGSTFQLDILDEDVAANDDMFSCAGPLTADLIRAYVLSCSSAAASPAGAGSAISFWFQPL
jgi:hypothetical protein